MYLAKVKGLVQLLHSSNLTLIISATFVIAFKVLL